MAGPMNCFAIRIEPTMPVILGKRLNLDAILAFLLLQRLRAEGVDEYDALQRAHTEIPLARVNSVFAGSSALIRKTTTNQRTVYGSLQRHVTAIPNVETLLEKNASASQRSGGREFDKIEKRYQTIVSNFEYYDLHKPNSAESGRGRTPAEEDRGWGIWFVGYGDRDVTEDLMNDLRYIGAKRTPIRQAEFFDAAPSSSPGLLGHNGEVLRPVPCTDDFNPTTFSRAHERFRPPYWRSPLAIDPVLCYVPSQSMWQLTGHIEQMIGVV